MKTEKFDYPDFNVKITDLLEGSDVSLLTERASKLLEGDLMALAWRRQTSRTKALTSEDLNSIVNAFNKHSFMGSGTSPELVGGSCSSCSIVCCCTASAVVNPVLA